MVLLAGLLVVAGMSLLQGLVESSYHVPLEVPLIRKETISRAGCSEVLSCTGFEDHPGWTKEGIDHRVYGESVLTNSTSNGVLLFSHAIVFNSLQKRDTGIYSCRYHDGHGATKKIGLTLLVKEEMVEILPISNITLSSYSYGREITISCFVETCIQDIVVQIFKDDQLLETETYPSGNQFVTSAQVKVTEKLAGRYACQALSEIENLVKRQFFSATGTPQQ